MKLSTVDASRGAPMGRPSTTPETALPSVRLHLAHLPLDSGGYDSGGAYWGLRMPQTRRVACRPIGHPADAPPIYRDIRQTPRIYRYWNEAEGIEGTLDAFDREDAKRQILADVYPTATFYR